MVGLIVVGAAVTVIVSWLVVSARREREGLDTLQAMIEDNRKTDRKGEDQP